MYLSVREIESRDIRPITRYWLDARPEYLIGMGVDLQKVPPEAAWEQMLAAQIQQDYTEKQSYCIIWECDGEAIGHSNVNKIVFGESAYMHLHLWRNEVRQKGLGLQFIGMTLPWFFDKLQLQTIYCEPYAHNPAPNKALQKAGFSFVKTHRTTPGWLNFEQEVNLWKIERPS